MEINSAERDCPRREALRGTTEPEKVLMRSGHGGLFNGGCSRRAVPHRTSFRLFSGQRRFGGFCGAVDVRARFRVNESPCIRQEITRQFDFGIFVGWRAVPFRMALRVGGGGGGHVPPVFIARSASLRIIDTLHTTVTTFPAYMRLSPRNA